MKKILLALILTSVCNASEKSLLEKMIQPRIDLATLIRT
jgi:hypothetical protein